MAGDDRTALDAVAPVVDDLVEQIARHDFIAAVRRLENRHADKPRVGDALRARDDAVRLSQQLSLGFRGPALHSLEPGEAGRAPRLKVNFMGLLGAQGPLPLHLSEYADQRARHHADPTFREFIDLFNHRLLSLFYKASVQFDPAIGADRTADNPQDRFLGALAGVMPDAARGRDSLPDTLRRYYPAWFGSRTRAPDGLVALIRDQFDLPVRISEFVGGWLPLNADTRARLGRQDAGSQLGRAMYIGRRVWSARHRFRIHLGPLDRQDFQSFRPGSVRAARLHDLVRFYTGDEWDWDLELQVEHASRQGIRLDHRATLGFDSWLGQARVCRGDRASRVRLHRSVLAVSGPIPKHRDGSAAAHDDRQGAGS